MFLIFLSNFLGNFLTLSSKLPRQFSCLCYRIFNLQEFSLPSEATVLGLWPVQSHRPLCAEGPDLVYCSVAAIKKFIIIFRPEVSLFHDAAIPVSFFEWSLFLPSHSCFLSALSLSLGKSEALFGCVCFIFSLNYLFLSSSSLFVCFFSVACASPMTGFLSSIWPSFIVYSSLPARH